MTMPGRSVHSDRYRYGFNGKANDEETGLQDYCRIMGSGYIILD